MDIGGRLLPATIDLYAQTTPDKICFSIPLGPQPTEYVDIDYRRFSNSISRLSWWLRGRIGLSTSFETVCYIGPPDLTYFMFAMAACKCGYKTLFTSPRNTIEAHVSLIKTTECRYLFGPSSKNISSIVSSESVEHINTESLEYWLDETPVEHFAYEKSFKDLSEQSLLVLHTSGTTGLPKPVNITHGLVSVVDRFQELPSIDGRDVWAKRVKGRRIFCCLPPFHSAGTNFFIFCIFFGAVLVLPPTSQPPDLNLVETILDQGLADAGCMAPSILEEISASPVLEKLRSWEFVAFGGSPLSKAAGDKLWDKTKVFNLLGSTETYVLPELEPRSKDEWQYHAFHPLLGLEFEERSPERYEAVFKRTDESSIFQGCFQTFPKEKVYAMGDLYSKHSSNGGLWLYRGRADDIVVLSNGEKFNPQELESVISTHPDVRAVLAVGDGRTQAALLIEPEKSLSSLPESQQIDRVWEKVTEANEVLPSHAQIDKEHIFVLAPEDEFPRSSKGAVQRKNSLDLKQDIIEELYNLADSRHSAQTELDLESPEAFERTLLETVQASSASLRNIEVDSNFFESGMDSLQAVQLCRTLRGSLEPFDLPDQFLKPALIYKHPTVQRLAPALRSVVMGGDLPMTPPQEQEDILTEMQSARKRYAVRKLSIQERQVPDGKTVLLTGSTGRLGSYLLHALLSARDVQRIYCLGRSSPEDLRERQTKSQQEKALSCDFERVSFHQSDFEKENWGLEDSMMEMSKSVTHIIHNAWPVNFNHSFDHFEPQLKGCQRLSEMAAQFSQLQNVFFVSSVGAANNRSMNVPEEILDDMLSSEGTGYAQSKLVAELVLADAAAKNGIPTTICRVGQIAGAAERDGGSWNKAEWFPSLMLTSKTIGQIPNCLGAMDQIDWLPSDLLGHSLVEMAFSGSSDTRVLHAVNPNTVKWSTLLDELEDSSHLKRVDFADWIESVREASEKSEALEKVPAVKLLDFYTSLCQSQARPVFETAKSTGNSQTLRGMSRIRADWLEKWISQW